MLKETEYYDIPGVRPFASEEEIRRAYYLKARQVHPDKIPNDPLAAEKFQETMLDHAWAVFAFLFGSELFEDYIGHLAVASMASTKSSGESDNPDKVHHRLKAVHREREENIARKLKDFLRCYDRGDKEGFLKQAKSEAQRLSLAASGAEILHTIGYIYTRQAALELGKIAIYLGVPFMAEWVRNEGQSWKSQFTAAKGAFELLQLQENIRNQTKLDGSASENDVEPLLRLNKETLMNSLWKLVDVEVTPLPVCQMVLQENNVRREELRMRAVALKILGKTFQDQRSRQNAGPLGKKKASIEVEDTSSDSSDEDDDSPTSLNYRTPLLTQGIGLFMCLCNPAFYVDGDEIVYTGR